ncbi:hypothetical protein MTP99_018943 [Tenebrio molitor]|nr:hypothetical protein MTP99_018943 [Tenebrio molitor]
MRSLLRGYLLEVSCLGWAAVVVDCCTVCTGVLACVSRGCRASRAGGFTGAVFPGEAAHPPFMSCKQPPHINQVHFTASSPQKRAPAVWRQRWRWHSVNRTTTSSCIRVAASTLHLGHPRKGTYDVY